MIENKYLLEAEPEFWGMTQEELMVRTNGCGAMGGFFSKVKVPDILNGVDESMPCRIHDYDYSIGKTEEDKINADWRLFHNMLHLSYLKYNDDAHELRHSVRDCWAYYEAVSKFGRSAFWDGKNKSSV